MEQNTNISTKELPIYDKNDIEQCIEKFQAHIINNINDITKLKNNLLNLSFEGKIESELMSSFSLKIYLKSLSTDKDITLKSWLEDTLSQRNAYKEKLKNLVQINKFKGDPLGGGDNVEEGGWNNFFEKKEIKELINTDIAQTFQDKNLFKEPSIKEIEYNILFLFAENNQPISYKEGMSNILAMLIYILYPYYTKNENKNYNNEIFDKWVGDPINNIKDIYYFFHDEDELQSDLYYLMDNLMKLGVNKFYEENKDKEKNENYLVKRCDKIFDKIKLKNNKIYNHFIHNSIDYEKIFQKWIKYIFTKDLNLKDCNIIWNIILANEIKNPSGELNYINNFCIALIDIISDELLKKEQNECFEALFNYPPLENINNLISLAEKNKPNSNMKHIMFANDNNNISEPAKKSSSSMFNFLYSAKNNNDNNNNKNNINNNSNNNININNNNMNTINNNKITDSNNKTTKAPILMFGGNFSSSNNKSNQSNKPKIVQTNNQQQTQAPKKIPMFGGVNNNEQSKNNKKPVMKFDFVQTATYHVSNEENIKMLNELRGLIDYYIKEFSDDDKMKISFLIDKLSKEL